MAVVSEDLSQFSSPSTWESFKQGMKASGLPWLFIAPSFILMIFITFIPQGFQIVVSLLDFTTQNLGKSIFDAEYVGLQNFREVLSGELNIPNYSFFPLLGFNISWTIINVFFHATIGLAVAMALNGKYVLGRRFYRALFVLPWAMPGYIIGLIWNNLWQENSGGINLLAESVNNNLGTSFPTDTAWLTEIDPPIDLRGTILNILIVVVCVVAAYFLIQRTRRLGLMNERGYLDVSRTVFSVGSIIILLAAAIGTGLEIIQNGAEASNPAIELFDRAGAPVLAFYSVLIANIWLGWPFMMVVATGALQSIPPDLYEAADVDGATKREQFFQITLPLIRPAMVPAIMLGTIWTFNQFNVIFFITAGGPRNQTDLLITQSFKLIQQEQLYGSAAAFSIVVFFVLLALTLLNNRITRATRAYDEA